MGTEYQTLYLCQSDSRANADPDTEAQEVSIGITARDPEYDD